MPIGNAYATGNIIAFIEQYHLKNKKLNVLDVGCGTGHNGFIFREMFEIRYCRLNPIDWMYRIEAVEIFGDYRNPVWDYVYDEVMVCDCLKALPLLKNDKYDIVFATDVLEHFEKEEMRFLLDKLIEKLRAKLHNSRNGMVLRKTIKELEWLRANENKSVAAKAYECLKKWAKRGLYLAHG